MDLIRTFSDETYRRALEDWSWLDLTDTVPLCASPFGDVFFQSRDGIVYLDMLEGRVSALFVDASTMQAVLESEEGQDRYLMAGLALAAERAGQHLGPDDVQRPDPSAGQGPSAWLPHQRGHGRRPGPVQAQETTRPVRSAQLTPYVGRSLQPCYAPSGLSIAPP